MSAKTNKAPRVIAFDGDRLGAVAGASVALVVAVVQMFAQDADPRTTIVRSAWAFVGAYAATFALARIILRLSLFEMLAEKASRREARRDARGKHSAEARGGAGTEPAGEIAAKP